MASAHPNLTPRAVLRWLRSLARDTAGAALVEITLFMPILVLMAVAIINFALYFSYSIQVENAAQAGAQWAITNAQQFVQSGYPSGSVNTAGLNANNLSLASVFSTISVPTTCSGSSTCCITRFCGCPSSSGVTNLSTATPPVTPPSCAVGAACSDGSHPGIYVQACATGRFTPFAKYGSFFPSSYSPSSTATVRVQ
jgi:Flp pilus assembly protein TadG